MKYHGLMGLGFRAISEHHLLIPMEALKSNGVIPRTIFSFCLYPQSSSKKSVLIIAGSDSNLYEDPMHFIPLTEIGYWQVNMVRLSVGYGYVLCERGCATILDSGTTLIVGPQDEVHQLNTKRLKGRKHKNGSYLIHCARVRTLPTIVIEMNDVNGQRQKFPLDSSQYVRKVSTSACHSICQPEIFYSNFRFNFLYVFSKVVFFSLTRRAEEVLFVRPVSKGFV